MLGRYYGVSMQNVTNGFWVEQGAGRKELAAGSKV